MMMNILRWLVDVCEYNMCIKHVSFGRNSRADFVSNIYLSRSLLGMILIINNC